MTTTDDFEFANAHDSGDCTPECPHPDHYYDDPLREPLFRLREEIDLWDNLEPLYEWAWEEDDPDWGPI